MDRQWIYLVAFFYVLLALPLVISAPTGAGVEVLLDFTTLYLVAWALIVVWWYGEHISSLLQTSQESLGSPTDDGHPSVADGKSGDEKPSSIETPRLVRIALDEAARKLANLGMGSSGGATSSPATSGDSRPSPTPRTGQPSQTSPSPTESAESPQPSPADAPFAIEELVERAVSAMQAPEKRDPCVKRLPAGRVRVIVSTLIPSEGPKQAVSFRRRRFRQQLGERLASIGWHEAPGAAVYTYRREPASK